VTAETGSTKRCSCKNRQKAYTWLCHPGRSCNTKAYANLAELEVVGGTFSAKWLKINTINLYAGDREVLISSDWLNDNLISAAQHLMKKRYPNICGLQNTILQVTRSFEIQGSKGFVQCLNLQNSHWITISTLACPSDSVRVYGSLNYSPSSLFNKYIIAYLLQTTSKAIKVEHANVQQQKGRNGIGLFAVATAYTLCSGENPVQCSYDQSSMRLITSWKHFHAKQEKSNTKSHKNVYNRSFLFMLAT